MIVRLKGQSGQIKNCLKLVSNQQNVTLKRIITKTLFCTKSFEDGWYLSS
jgi:hypothetical protein